MLRTLLVSTAAVAALATAVPAHATTRCVVHPTLGGACVEVNAPGGTGPTARVSCGGTFWECKTITVP